jgi:hypothetical protein
MSRVVWIDWSRNERIIPHPEAVLVEDHVSFLGELESSATLYVRGHGLGQWASTLAVARDWERNDVVEPITGLQASVPALTKDEAEEILKRLDVRFWDVAPTFLPLNIARVLHPHQLWEPFEDDEHHAALWLLWMVNNTETTPFLKVCVQVAASWVKSSTPTGPDRAYAISTPDESLQLLEEWLGMSSTEDSWPRFPDLPIPSDVISALLERFTKRLKENPELVLDLVHGKAFPSELMNVITSRTGRFLAEHSEFLTESRVDWLAGYLPNQLVEQLRANIRPDDPGMPPESFADVPRWFLDHYLPWRKWSARNLSDSVVHDRVNEIGRSFAEAYLEELTRQVQMSTGQRVLTWQRTHELLSKRDGVVTLLVALDGLSLADLPNFLRHFREWVPELTVQGNDVVGVPLPTVTPFTKPALMTGSTPAAADPASKSGSHRISGKFSELLDAISTARPGDVIVWQHVEPDHTYHHDFDREGLKYSVDNELRKIAQQLAALSDAAPPSSELRVVISSDHGRLIGPSQRLLPVPSSGSSRGRAAWGALETVVGEQGYVIEDDVAILDPVAYRLPSGQLYALSLSDKSFKKNDESGGTEWFTHGGAFPEEVFVPWIVATKGLEIRPVSSNLTGSGKPQEVGQLSLQVENPNRFAISIVGLRLQFGPNARPLEVASKISEAATELVQFSMEDWPSAQDCDRASAFLIYELPDKSRREQSIDAKLTSESIYEADNILEGLEP